MSGGVGLGDLRGGRWRVGMGEGLLSGGLDFKRLASALTQMAGGNAPLVLRPSRPPPSVLVTSPPPPHAPPQL